MDKRVDPLPDPYAKQPVVLTRQPGRAQPKSIAVDSTRPVDRMRAHVHSSGTQSIPNTTPTVVTFSVVDFDTVGLFTANKFTIPSTGKVTGCWMIHGVAMFDVAGATLKLVLRKNGATALHTDVRHGGADVQSLSVQILINDPIPGDYFELLVSQTSGAPLDLLKAADQTFFEIIHLW